MADYNMKLPNEIWLQIFSNLPTEDFVNCRLVCTSWNSYTTTVDLTRILLYVPFCNPQPDTLLVLREEKLTDDRPVYHRLTLPAIVQKLGQLHAETCLKSGRLQIWIYGVRPNLELGFKDFFARFGSNVTHLTLLGYMAHLSDLSDLQLLLHSAQHSLEYFHLTLDSYSSLTPIPGQNIFRCPTLPRLRTLVFTSRWGHGSRLYWILQEIFEKSPNLAKVSGLPLQIPGSLDERNNARTFDLSILPDLKVLRSFFLPGDIAPSDSPWIVQALLTLGDRRQLTLTSLTIHPQLIASESKERAYRAYAKLLRGSKDSLEKLEMPWLDLNLMSFTFPKFNLLTQMTFRGKLANFRRLFALPPKTGNSLSIDPARVFPNLEAVNLKSSYGMYMRNYVQKRCNNPAKSHPFSGVKSLKLGPRTVGTLGKDLCETFPNIRKLHVEEYEILPQLHNIWPNLCEVTIAHRWLRSSANRLFKTFITETLPIMREMRILKFTIESPARRVFGYPWIAGQEGLWVQSLANVLRSGQLEKLQVYIVCDWRDTAKWSHYSHDVRHQFAPLQSLAVFNF